MLAAAAASLALAPSAFAGGTSTGADFNGDGYGDLAIGAPLEDVEGQNQGVVHVFFGSAAGLTATANQLLRDCTDCYTERDRFGTALASGDFDGDGFDDLAASELREGDFGSVHIFHGGPNGLGRWRGGHGYFSQASYGVPGGLEIGDGFGSVLAAGDFDFDGYDDLAIGVPGEDVGSIVDAGAINVIFGSKNGLRGSGSLLIHQDTKYSNGTGVLDEAEAFDRFGEALVAADFGNGPSADLVVGVPREDRNGKQNSGFVHVFYGADDGFAASGDQGLYQNGPVPGDEEAGDFFGASLAAANFGGTYHADLAIGVPFESVGTVPQAGAVNVVYGTDGGLQAVGAQLWHQDIDGVEDQAEPYDLFGSALTAGYFNSDTFADLAAGAYWETVGSVVHAGAVNVIHGSQGGLSQNVIADQLWYQDIVGTSERSEAEDGFGRTLSAGDFDGDGRWDELVVGVPSEDLGGLRAGVVIENAGVVHVLRGGPSGLGGLPGNQLWHQNVAGIEDIADANDQFGSALPTVP